MRRLFEFRCEDGHVTEFFVDESKRKETCPTCGKEAHRVVSPVRCYLDPISGDFPGATARWARMREEKRLEERKKANA